MAERKITTYVNLIQILLGLNVFFLFCLAFYFLGGMSPGSLWPMVLTTAKAAVIPTGIYAINYCILVPGLFFNGHKKWFFLTEVVLIIVAIILPVIFMDIPQGIDLEQIEQNLNGLSLMKILTGSIILRVVLYLGMIALSIGMRYVIRWYEERKKREEERRRNAEAELTWLKNQLNPHFLFNTLNNISSLTQIDADKAQESIGQFSELLRYALYESNVEKVRLTDETEFMKNYIDLMSLRCNEKTRIETRFDSFDEGLTISPLLFISLIENAFKHGTSSHKESFVKVDMGLDGEDLVFSCENSVHERTSEDRSGSVIGLENMTRRLDLLYPDAYTYRQYVEDNTYIAIVRIRKITKP